MQEHKTVDYSDKGKRKLVEEVRTLRSRLSKLEHTEHPHKEAKQPLQCGKQEWEDALNAISDWVALTDLKGRILRTNRTGQNFTGKRLTQIIGQSCCKLVHGSDNHIPGCPLKKMLKSRQRETAELQVPNTDRWLMVTTDPVTDKKGNLIGAVHITRDITERKKTVEALKESEERYRNIFNSVCEAVFIIDFDGRIIDANPKASYIYGYSPEEFTNLPAKRLIHPEDHHIFDEHIEILAKTGEFHSEHRNVRKDGTIIDVEVSATTIECEGKKFLVSIINDITDRKKAMDMLRESEQRYQAIFKQAADSIVLINAETGELAEFNDKAHESLGYSREEFQKLKIPDFEIIESADEVAKHIEKIVRGGADTFETKHRTKGGEVRDIMVSSRAITIRGRDFVQSIWRDITQHKRAEEALRESEARLSVVFEKVPAVLILVDRDRRVHLANEAAIRFARRTADEMTGLRGGDALRCLHFLDDPKGCGYGPFCETCVVRNTVLETFKAGKSFYQREAQLPFDIGGETRELSLLVSTSTFKVSGHQRVLVCLEDITDRRRTEGALRESEERYRQLVSTTTDAIMLFDAQTRKFIDVNKACEDLYGYSRDEFLNLRHKDITAEPGESEVSIRQALEGKRDRIPVRYHKKKDGTVFPVEISASTFELAGRKVLCGVIRDITERRKAEEQARRDRAELERTSRLITVGEMTSGLAHELNQPLCAILNYADGCLRMVRTQTPDSGKLEGAIEAIAAQADRAAEIIRSIRNLVTKREQEQSTVNLNDIVREIVEMEKAEASQNNITVQTELAEDLPLVLADRIEIEQVVLNLVRNAFEAMSDTAVGERKVTIRTSRLRGDSIELAVCDTGQGVPAEDVEKLFDSFFTTKPDGLGIGLSLSRSIIEAHRGRLWAEPNPDCGATFRFTLPLKGG